MARTARGGALTLAEIVEGPVEQTLTFEAGPGAYDYVCVVHPNEMTGTLEVS